MDEKQHAGDGAMNWMHFIRVDTNVQQRLTEDLRLVSEGLIKSLISSNPMLTVIFGQQ